MFLSLEKLGDFDQTDSSNIVKDEEDGKEKRKRKQKKIIEELVMTEKSYVFNTSLVTEKVLKHLAEFQVIIFSYLQSFMIS